MNIPPHTHCGQNLPSGITNCTQSKDAFTQVTGFFSADWLLRRIFFKDTNTFLIILDSL